MIWKTKTKHKVENKNKKTRPQRTQKGMGKRAQKPKEMIVERPMKKRDAGPPLKISPCTKKQIATSGISPETVVKNIRGQRK